VTFMMSVPTKTVSGSEVLYSPVGIATQTFGGTGASLFDGEQTILEIYENTAYQPNTPPQRMSVEGNGLPQPSLFFVPNKGSYRMEFTGDITIFKKDFIHFQIYDPEVGELRASRKRSEPTTPYRVVTKREKCLKPLCVGVNGHFSLFLLLLDFSTNSAPP